MKQMENSIIGVKGKDDKLPRKYSKKSKRQKRDKNIRKANIQIITFEKEKMEAHL